MTLMEEKIDFVKFVLRHEFVEDKRTDDFFRTLIKREELLEKIHFSLGKSKVNFKYKLILNLRNGIFLFETRRKKYNDRKLLRSIIKLIEVSPNGTVCLCIMDKQNMIKKQALKVDYSERMIYDLAFDAYLDLVIINEKKKMLMDKIDQSLVDNNFEEFKKLSEEYKHYV